MVRKWVLFCFFVCALFSLDHLYLRLKIEHCSLRAFTATLLSNKNNIPVSLGLLLVLKGSLFTSQNYHTIIVGAGLQGPYKEAGLTKKAGAQSRQIQISLLSYKVSWWSDPLACHALVLSPWFTLFKRKLQQSFSFLFTALVPLLIERKKRWKAGPGTVTETQNHRSSGASETLTGAKLQVAGCLACH